MIFEAAKQLLQKCVPTKFPTNIEVFARHCHFSDVSTHKKRPDGFSRKNCFENFVATLEGQKKVNVTFFLDTFFPMNSTHFILEQDRFPVVQYKQGSEGGSFCFLLDYVLQQSFSPDTIVYFLEDDYLHKPNWPKVLREAFNLEHIEYVSLYDHRDKYFLNQYKGLKSELFVTESAHWRESPSTTNTYAMKFSTLKRDQELHYAFSRGKKISEDHAKFCALKSQGSRLITPIPGFSTHMEPDYASPCVDWNLVQSSTLAYYKAHLSIEN
ncbi:MAG: hypothetical protein EBZ47_07355 [Chlamydiae bacterium]|nr:hypothetical protein [Chlamydiota bacterium]